MKTFKESEPPLAWSHFKGDAGSTTFRALIYIPSGLPNDFYSKDYVTLDSLKLFVRRVFITSDLGKDYLERHLNWVKVFIDVDDLPLNVGRDSLQKTRALAQIKRNLQKRVRSHPSLLGDSRQPPGRSLARSVDRSTTSLRASPPRTRTSTTSCTRRRARHSRWAPSRTPRTATASSSSSASRRRRPTTRPASTTSSSVARSGRRRSTSLRERSAEGHA